MKPNHTDLSGSLLYAGVSRRQKRETMKLYLEFESDGSCRNCPAHVLYETNEYCGEFGICSHLKTTLKNIYQRHEDCPARLSPNDEIKAGEIAALKAEIQRLQGIIRGES